MGSFAKVQKDGVSALNVNYPIRQPNCHSRSRSSWCWHYSSCWASRR
jgi:hypothetical protein